MLNIVIPMAGRGERFRAAGYEVPKPLIPLPTPNGAGAVPMIVHVIRNVCPKDQPFKLILLVLREHLEDLSWWLALGHIDAVLIPVDTVTQGTACTVLLAKDHLDLEEPLLVANSDQLFDASIDDFLKSATSYHGYLMTFHPASDPKWSYVVRARTGGVTKVIEKPKSRVSDEANVGVYYFRKVKYFTDAAETMIAADVRTNGEFYLAPTYNVLTACGFPVGAWDIDAEQMHGLGTPEDLQAYERFLAGDPQRVIARRPQS